MTADASHRLVERKTQVDVTATARHFRRFWMLARLIGVPAGIAAVFIAFMAYVLLMPGMDAVLPQGARQEFAFAVAPEVWAVLGVVASVNVLPHHYSATSMRFFALYWAVAFIALAAPAVRQLSLWIAGVPSNEKPFVPWTLSWELSSYLGVLTVCLVACAFSLRMAGHVETFSRLSAATSLAAAARRSLRDRFADTARRIGAIMIGIVLFVMSFALLSVSELLLLLSAAKIAGKTLTGFSIIIDPSAELAALLERSEFGRYILAQSLIATKLVLYVFFLLACRWIVRFVGRLARPNADAVMTRNTYAPVTMLRSFEADDTRILGRSVMSSMFRRPQRFEEVLAQDISSSGPFIAIGKPGEKLKPLGAYRNYYADDRWRDAIRSWMSRSRYIVAVAGTTPSFGWEIEEVVRGGHLAKLVVVMPPSTQGELERRWQFLRDRIEGAGGRCRLPLDPPSTLLALGFVTDPPTMVTSRARHGVDYHLAIRAAAP